MQHDGGFSKVLDESLATRCQTEDPVVCAFFRSPRPNEKPRRPVSAERWVSASLDASADLSEVQDTARMVTEELVTTPVSLMREILTDSPGFLPELPRWADGETLRTGTSRLRFGVLGGNQGSATGNVLSDLKRAYVRLLAMNSRDPLDADETVRVICPVGLAGEFEKVRGDLPFSFEPMSLPNLTARDPWFLVRRPVAVIKMDKPTTTPPPCTGSFMRLGVRYTVWLDNPASVVCTLRPEMASATN